MSIKSSYFVPTNTRFAVGQKFITINVGDKSYSFPILYSQSNNNSSASNFNQYFFHQGGVSYIFGNHLRFNTTNSKGNIQYSCKDLILNGCKLNTANGLVKLNQSGKIPNQFLAITLDNIDVDLSDVVRLNSDNKIPKQYIDISLSDVVNLTEDNKIPSSLLQIDLSDVDLENIVTLQNGKISNSYLNDNVVILNESGKIPNDYLDIDLENIQIPTASGSSNIVAVSYNSTITLPIPYDKQNESVTLIIDFIPYENQQQIVQFKTQYVNSQNIDVSSDYPFGYDYTSSISSTSNSSWLSHDENGYGRSFYRISMANEQHRQYMWVYNKDKFVKVTSSSLIVASYGQNVTFTLNSDILPGYKPGKTYFARYTWMDLDGGFMDWKGFKFSGDVVEMAFPQDKLEEQVSIYQFENDILNVTENDETGNEITTLPQFDYNNGQVQKLALGGVTTIDVDNVYNIPYGKGLKLLVNTATYLLNLIGQSDYNQQITENGRYLIEIQNFSQHIISYKKIL